MKKVQNATHAMVLLADAKWHNLSEIYEKGVPVKVIFELYEARIVECSMGSVRLSERGVVLFDRAVTRMLIAVDKKKPEEPSGALLY